VPGSMLHQRRIGRPAFGSGEAAARCKGAAFGQISERRNHASDLVQARVTAAGMRRGFEVGDRAEQPPGVGVAGAFEQLLGARLLDLSAGIHHHNPVGILGDHAHVVGDQNDRGAEPVLKLAHQIEYLALVETERVLEINPNDAESFRERDAMLVWAGEAAQASPWLEGALRLDPIDARAAFLLGIADYFLDRYDKALEAMNRGLAGNLGRTTQLMGRPVWQRLTPS
jgi:hypothetical protein